MGKKIIGWGFGVIALYLVVYYWTGASKAESAAASGGVSLIQAFQGR